MLNKIPFIITALLMTVLVLISTLVDDKIVPIALVICIWINYATMESMRTQQDFLKNKLAFKNEIINEMHKTNINLQRKIVVETLRKEEYKNGKLG